MTATQLRQVITDLIAAGQWQPGDPDILIVADAHGGEFVFGDPATWGDLDITRHTGTRLYGPATARAWNRLHPRSTHRTAWVAHTGNLPIPEGTVILLEVACLPSGAIPKPVWLWHSGINQTVSDVDRLWQAFLRRVDIEHTFRMFKQTLGWTAPKLRTPEAADRWTWLILVAYTQLRLARCLAADLRRPGEKPTSPDRHDVHIVTATTTKNPKSSTPRPRRKGQNSS